MEANTSTEASRKATATHMNRQARARHFGRDLRIYLSKAAVLDTMVTPERDGTLSLPDHLADELIRFSLLPKGLAGIICRHLLGQTTDADRLALAKLLA